MNLKFNHSEFEYEVRERLNVFDRPVTDEDAKLITELDLSNFDFRDEDIETLFYFENLKELCICISTKGSDFWNHFPHLEELFCICWGNEVDFKVFSHMSNLSDLTVSGGDISDIAFKNLDALTSLKKLENLSLHEFGPVDLKPLENMTQLRRFYLGYSDMVKNIDIIGKMAWLEELYLLGIYIDNLDFLDTLPDSIRLEMCGVEIYGRTQVDVQRWKRFEDRDICEISIKNPYWYDIDLSALDD